MGQRLRTFSSQRYFRLGWQALVLVSLLLTGQGFFTNYEPPYPPFANFISIVSALLALGWGALIPTDAKKAIRRSLILGSIALMMLVTYGIALRYVTVVAPPPHQAVRVQIGFHKADWSLTDAARAWKRDHPNDTPQRLMLAFVAFDEEGARAEVIWKPWAITVAGLLLIALYLGACFLWHLSLGLLCHERRFRPGWSVATAFGQIEQEPSTADTSTMMDESQSGSGVAGREGPPEIPDYQLHRRIGRGGMADVWLGQNRIDRHYCAIKIFPADAFVEVKALREYKHRIAEHDHLLPIGQVGQIGDWCYYVMPLADDACGISPLVNIEQYEPMTLERVLRLRGRLPLEEAVEITRQMLLALSHLHGQGARHGDVKPANIIRRRGRWQLGDHGLVSNLESAEPRPCDSVYCPPEGPGGREADLYALGITLFEMSSGREPRELRRLLDGDFSVVGQGSAAERLARVIQRACATEPDARFQWADDMLEALEAGQSD